MFDLATGAGGAPPRSPERISFSSRQIPPASRAGTESRRVENDSIWREELN